MEPSGVETDARKRVSKVCDAFLRIVRAISV